MRTKAAIIAALRPLAAIRKGADAAKSSLARPPPSRKRSQNIRIPRNILHFIFHLCGRI
jgi:hypothetical protein